MQTRRTSVSGKLIETIIDRVITAKECDIHDIPPLYETIDPDALAALYTRGSPKIHFEYAGCDIEITPEQTVSITPNE